MSDFNQAVAVLLKGEGVARLRRPWPRAFQMGITLKSAQELHPEWTAPDIANLTRVMRLPSTASGFGSGYTSVVFDLGVNIGNVTAIRILQLAAGIGVDGILGEQTAQKANGLPAQVVIEAVHRGRAWKDDLPGCLARLDE